MKEFWKSMRECVRLLSELDLEHKLVSGSNLLHYELFDTVGEKRIRSFEKEHGIDLPESYRSYLQYFGSGGVGPSIGVARFPDKIWYRDLSKPLCVDFFEGYLDTDEPDDSLINQDGMLGIGAIGELRIYLVVRGILAGYVVCWNSSYLMCISGPFDKWYKRWVECLVEAIKNYNFMKSIAVGTKFDELIFAKEIVVNRFPNEKFARFRNTNGWVEIDDSGRVVHVNLVYPITSTSGFTLWPYK